MSDAPFQFKFRGEADSTGRLTAAVVRYDGNPDKLARAASAAGVSVSEAKADKAGNPRIRVTGGNVEAALREYAQRAHERGRYAIGDV